MNLSIVIHSYTTHPTAIHLHDSIIQYSAYISERQSKLKTRRKLWCYSE